MRRLLQTQWILALSLLGMASSIALWVFTGQDKLGLDPELPPRLLVLSVLVLLAIAMVKRFLATGESGVVNRRMELSVLHKNGHEIPVELMVSALPTE